MRSYSNEIPGSRGVAALAALAMTLAACGEEPLAPEVGPTLDVVAEMGRVNEGRGQVFVVTSTTDLGDRSLRQAIIDSNGHPGRDIISFDIPGAGPHVIRPASPLPPIMDPVLLDGYSQPGASRNTSPTERGTNAVVKIALDASAAGPFVPGLVILAGDTKVRGLAIGHFQEGIVLASSGNRVAGILPDARDRLQHERWRSACDRALLHAQDQARGLALLSQSRPLRQGRRRRYGRLRPPSSPRSADTPKNQRYRPRRVALSPGSLRSASASIRPADSATRGRGTGRSRRRS
jgi:hypothetical protein